MPQEQKEAPNAASGEVKEASSEEIKTLGILFVHGIGEQKRGDTIVQCGAAIHSWLRRWITQPSLEEGSISVDLVNTNLTQPRADEPAHSRLIFRKGEGISHLSWVLTESCWAEAFRPPGYRAFVRWAIRVLPLTAIFHLLALFRRSLRVMNATMEGLEKGYVTLETRSQLQRELGPRYGSLPAESTALSKLLRTEALRADGRLLLSVFLLPLFLFVSVLLQALLLVVMIVSILPVDFLRSLAGRVQKTFAATLGDSYLFVTSPISASAAVSQVKKDLAWLAERCDCVVLIAHSQGAALAYRAIEECSWEGRVPQKLKHFITYGSGLQKLRELEQLSHGRSRASALELWMTGVFIAIGTIGVMTFVPWVAGAIPLILFALSFAAGFISLMFGLFFADRVFGENYPTLLSNIRWINLFASHDPVSNGPLSIAEPKHSPVSNQFLAKAIDLASRMIVDFFHMGQREVVNLQSAVADHTTYWSAADDFVSRVVTELLHISKIESPATPDAEWLDLSVQRRRWRVGLRRACRNVAILAALFVAFWPDGVLRSLGDALLRAFAALPKQWIPDWIKSVAIPVPLLGAGMLLACIYAVFAIALAGWNMWERREIAHFFRREPFRAGGTGLAVFATGWLGLLIITPAATAYVAGRQSLWPSLGSSLLLLAVSCGMLVKSGKGPGRLSNWISVLLQRGELLLEQKTGDRSENLAQAQGYFSWAVKWLLDEKDSMERVRALLGGAHALEQREEANEDKTKRLTILYKEALASLERMGEDTGEVQERLNALSSGTSGINRDTIAREGTSED